MASFQDLGLREPLLRALEDGAIERPTALQEATIPVLRREGNVIARASSGSGKTLAYGLGILDRLEAGGSPAAGEEGPPGPRMLVLCATPEAAARAALELVPYALAVDAPLAASGGGWGTAAAGAAVLIATPAEVLESVRISELKLEGVEAVVIDGASEIDALGGWEALETLFDHVPRDAQRVVVTAETTEGIEDLAARRVKRALRYPVEPASPDRHAPEPEAVGVVGYVPVREQEKVATVARLLGGGSAAPVLHCRTAERAAALAEALALRGFAVGDPGEPGVDVVVTAEPAGEEPSEPGGPAISFDVPADEETLRRRHTGGEPGYVLVEPRELAHLRQIARRAAVSAHPAGVTGEEPRGAAEVRAFRGELRRALREEDLAAQMLLLEPLLEDFTAVEIAAAASALLRRRPAEPPREPPAAPPPVATDRERAQRPTRPEGAGRPAPGGGAAYTRLFISLGERDGTRPADLVGAIAGEAGIAGAAVGKIEIRDTFSIVEVPASAAEGVIAALNGITIRGRSVRVDYDRQRPAGGARGPAGRGPRPGGAGGAAPRRGGPPRRPREGEPRRPPRRPSGE
jgi:ATP-dependent RNA helicase DeaD